MQFFHIAPLVFLVAGFVLVNLTLFAGDKAGFMEEYAIVRVSLTLRQRGMGNMILYYSQKKTPPKTD